MRAAPQWLPAAIIFLAAVAITAPSVIARARRNHRARKTRAAIVGAATWLDALVQEALEDGPVECTPIHDRLVCEQLERVNGWA